MCGWYGGSLNKDSITLFKGAIENLPKEKLLKISVQMQGSKGQKGAGKGQLGT